MATRLAIGVALLFLAVSGLFIYVERSADGLSAKENTSNPSAQVEKSAVWREVDCWFSIPRHRAATCGEFAKSSSNHIFTLPVVIIRDHSKDHQPDPLVYLSGGPGSSNSLGTQEIQYWFDWADGAALSRDLVVMDVRGTGRAQPQFKCETFENYLRQTLKVNLNQADDAVALRNVLSGCIENFKAQDFSFSQFTTRRAAEDLQELMTLLTYREWNVMGGSYGTRLAMVWSMRFPGGLRSMVLDSVYPLGKGGLMAWPENLSKSFEALWPSCSQTETCDVFDQRIQQSFWQIVDQLNSQPVSVNVSLWEGGWPLDVVVNGHRFVSIAYGALYRSSGRSKIITALKELEEGNREILKVLTEQSVNSDLDPTFNPFTYFLVDCAENYRPTKIQFEQERLKYDSFKSITANGVAEDACQLFPSIEDLESFSQHVKDETPTLFLSGVLDPVTPARWVEDVREYYPLSEHWLMSEIGHGVSANSDCVMKSIKQFIDKPHEPAPNPCLTNQ